MRLRVGSDRIKHVHVGGLIPRLGIQPDAAAVVVDPTRTVFLEETEHRGTSGLGGVEYFKIRLR